MASSKTNISVSELMTYIEVPKTIQSYQTPKEDNTNQEVMDVDTFVSTFKNDPELARIPLPEWVYEKYNLPKPDVVPLKTFLNKSVKTVMFSGWNSETREPDNKGVRKMPFLSTVEGLDLSGNLTTFVSTFTE